MMKYKNDIKVTQTYYFTRLASEINRYEFLNIGFSYHITSEEIEHY